MKICNQTIHRCMSFILIPFALFALSATALAQDDPRKPSAQEIIEKLAPAQEEFQSKSFTTRSFNARGVTVEGRKAPAEETPSIDLDVNFEFNSAKLTADARIILDNLGRALSDPSLRDSHFMLAGHTDAKGGGAYNMALSKKRAQAVADYLIRQHGVESNRLKVKGFGSSRLLDTANPEKLANRRVQVVNLGKTQ